jgi:hypothetical protein
VRAQLCTAIVTVEAAVVSDILLHSSRSCVSAHVHVQLSAPYAYFYAHAVLQSHTVYHIHIHNQRFCAQSEVFTILVHTTVCVNRNSGCLIYIVVCVCARVPCSGDAGAAEGDAGMYIVILLTPLLLLAALCATVTSHITSAAAAELPVAPACMPSTACSS